MASPASALHVARVKSLYMKALKLARSWNPDRGLFREQASKIRAEFEMYRYVQEPAIAEALVRKTEQRIAAVNHPDPYILPTAPNGSKYARSPPVQPEVKIVKDFGKEAPFSWY